MKYNIQLIRSFLDTINSNPDNEELYDQIASIFDQTEGDIDVESLLYEVYMIGDTENLTGIEKQIRLRSLKVALYLYEVSLQKLKKNISAHKTKKRKSKVKQNPSIRFPYAKEADKALKAVRQRKSVLYQSVRSLYKKNYPHRYIVRDFYDSNPGMRELEGSLTELSKEEQSSFLSKKERFASDAINVIEQDWYMDDTKAIMGFYYACDMNPLQISRAVDIDAYYLLCSHLANKEKAQYDVKIIEDQMKETTVTSQHGVFPNTLWMLDGFFGTDPHKLEKGTDTPLLNQDRSDRTKTTTDKSNETFMLADIDSETNVWREVLKSPAYNRNYELLSFEYIPSPEETFEGKFTFTRMNINIIGTIFQMCEDQIAKGTRLSIVERELLEKLNMSVNSVSRTILRETLLKLTSVRIKARINGSITRFVPFPSLSEPERDDNGNLVHNIDIATDIREDFLSQEIFRLYNDYIRGWNKATIEIFRILSVDIFSINDHEKVHEYAQEEFFARAYMNRRPSDNRKRVIEALETILKMKNSPISGYDYLSTENKYVITFNMNFKKNHASEVSRQLTFDDLSKQGMS